MHRRRKVCHSHVEHVLEFAPELGVPHDVRHDADLEDGDKGRDLEEARGADGVRAVDGLEAVGEGRERVAALVDVPGEVEAGAGGDLAEEGELGDLAVLELDVAEAGKGLLVGPVEEAEGVVELEGDLGAELALEGREGRA